MACRRYSAVYPTRPTKIEKSFSCCDALDNISFYGLYYSSMDVFDKLKILTDAAKYDAACTSSGVNRSAPAGGIGNATACGICHTFSGDGRCVSLLKILMSNVCVYDCKYCVNRKSNDTPRATFTPREIADLTINFYRRNYIEGLFLSSGVLSDPTRTVELMAEALRILREEYRFYGYIHAKAIPGADEDALALLGSYADRMSVNIELPSEASLSELAPDKSKVSILRPMGFIQRSIATHGKELALPGKADRHFSPAGQSTQMIIGATPETDLKIMRLSEGLYNRFSLKRVFYSAYVPVVDNSRLPALDTPPPLLREHRLYQADWLLRYYGFTADELLSEQAPHFSKFVDPKCGWAIAHPEFFPVEVNTAPFEMLLRVPGIGVTSAKRIIRARRHATITFEGLRRLGAVVKRARFFVTCDGKRPEGARVGGDALPALLSDASVTAKKRGEQLSMFDPADPDLQAAITREEAVKCLTGQM